MLETALTLAENSDGIIQPALAWITTPFTFYLYSVTAFGLLVLLGLSSCVRVSRRKAKLVREIVQARKTVESSADEVDFTDKFASIDQELSSLATLGRPWQEFTETLIQPNSVDELSPYDTYKNTKRPLEFFEIEKFMEEIEPRFKPEQYIGVGLILTFLGLVAALVAAGPAFSGTNSAQITDALEKLISTAGAKFIASIGGLLAALTLGIIIERSRNSIWTALDQLCDAIEQRMEFASAERIAAQQFGYAKRQTKSLEELGNQIAVAIGNKIESAMTAMPALVGEAMQPVTDELKTVMGSLGEQGSAGMADLANKISQELTGAGQDSMDRMLQQIDALSHTMTSTVGMLGETTESLKNSLTGSAAEAANKLTDSSAAVADAVHSALSDLSSSQASMQSSMVQLVEKLEGGASKFDEQLQATREESSRELAGALQAMNETMLSNANDSAQQWGQKINDTLEAGAKRTAAELGHAVTSITDGIQRPMSEMTASLESLADRTSEIVVALGQINQQLSAHKQGLSDANIQLSTTSRTLSQASTSVKEASEPLRDASRSANSAATTLKEVTQESQSQISRHSDRMSSAIEEANRVLDELNSSWKSQAALLKDADEGLESAFQHITTNLEQSLSRLRDFNTGAWSNMSEALDSMNSIANELSDVAEDLNQVKNR